MYFAGAGIDLDLFAGLDEERACTVMPVSRSDGFLDVVGGVRRAAFRASVTVEDDAGRDFDGDGLFIDEGHGDCGVLDQKIFRFADEFGGEGDGFVVLGVGET